MPKLINIHLNNGGQIVVSAERYRIEDLARDINEWQGLMKVERAAGGTIYFARQSVVILQEAKETPVSSARHTTIPGPGDVWGDNGQ